MKKTCAARLHSGDLCGKPATLPDRELRDVVCSDCTRRLDRGRWHRSYHEAGRAIALDHLGVRLIQVSLHAPELSSTRSSPVRWGSFSAAERCLVLLAGGVAEDMGIESDGIGERDQSMDDLDIAYARRFARSLVGDESAAEAFLEVVRQDVVRMLAVRRSELNGLATALFERLRLNAEETAAILDPGPRKG
jgi:hypothetical protein